MNAEAKRFTAVVDQLKAALEIAGLHVVDAKRPYSLINRADLLVMDTDQKVWRLTVGEP